MQLVKVVFLHVFMLQTFAKVVLQELVNKLVSLVQLLLLVAKALLIHLSVKTVVCV